MQKFQYKGRGEGVATYGRFSKLGHCSEQKSHISIGQLFHEPAAGITLVLYSERYINGNVYEEVSYESK